MRWPGRRSRRSEPSDAAVVAAVLNGDADSYGLLVRRHQGGLYRQARGMGLAPDTAEDMVQETLVKAYSGLRSCRKPERFGAWASRILRNQCLDHLKSPRRRAVSFEEEGPGAEAAPGTDPGTELQHELDDALQRLSPLLREAFLLKHASGYTYEEVAEITDASPSAVKMRVHRAREELRDLLSEPAAVAM